MGMGNSAMVQVENVGKTYRLSRHNRIQALKNVTVSIARGQSAVITGPSGSGKSTLLNLLGCLDRPSVGRIFFAGEDVTDFSEEEICRIRRENIGFVFQQFHLLPGMAAWENVSIGLVPLGVGEKARRGRASALLEQLGLQERISHRPEEMSGGEQQRVAFARALIGHPRLLLADEPTSNIDAVSTQIVLEMLADLRNKDCTIVVATHNVDLFRQAPSGESLFDADIVYRLVGGTISPG